MIRNIVFDVGKVLVYFEPEYVLNYLKIEGRARKIILEKMFFHPMWEEGDRGILSKEELLDAFIRNAPEYEREIRLCYEHVDKSIGVMSHVDKWLQNLKERGYSLYIISNYGENTFEKTVNKMSFLSYMTGTIFSYKYKIIKPDVKIYQLLLEKYDLNASECVFIDDRMVNVDGAKAVGMQGILFENFEQANQELEHLLEK